MTTPTTTPDSAAETPAAFETHNHHPASDYIREGYLEADCVNVRLCRESRGVYAVEIDILDREYTFEDDVARAVAKQLGGRVLTSAGGNGITIMVPIGFRASPAFIKICELEATL